MVCFQIPEMDIKAKMPVLVFLVIYINLVSGNYRLFLRSIFAVLLTMSSYTKTLSFSELQFEKYSES